MRKLLKKPNFIHKIVLFLKKIFDSHQCIICFNHIQNHAIDSSPLCEKCLYNIHPVVEIKRAIGSSTISINALGSYTDTLASLIQSKYRRDPMAFWLIGEWMAAKLLQKQHMHFDFIVPVPLHRFKSANRWFNQSEEIALSMSKKMNIPILNLFTKTHMTKPQASLKNIAQRHENVKSTFKIKAKGLIAGKSILLVDDVYTTGATIIELAGLMQQERPYLIEVFVAARTI